MGENPPTDSSQLRWWSWRAGAQIPPEIELIVFRADDVESRRLLPALSESLPDVPRASLATSYSESDLRELVNVLGVTLCLSGADEDEVWHPTLAKFLEERRGRRERRHFRADIARRNRELERLTDVLELEVEERTGHLETSTRQEREKLGKERQLVRLLNEISAIDEMEDLLKALRRELRRFHQVQNLTIAIRHPDGGSAFWSFRGDQVLRTESRVPWPDDRAPWPGNATPWTESEIVGIRQFVANQFGRPFQQALILPLDAGVAGQGLLCVEVSRLDTSDREALDEILQDRLHPLAIAIERIFWHRRLHEYAVRWERTFDGFRDPIAVLGTDLTVLRGNKAFSKSIQRNLKCHRVFAANPEPCEGCPVISSPGLDETLSGTVRAMGRSYQLSSWPVREPGADRVSGRVNHYADLTEGQDLYSRMIQTEKMSAIGALAGHIAHELNNPLTGIRSLAQALRAEAGGEQGLVDDLGHIENAARRCQKIIRLLLDFTRGEESDRTSVNMDDVVNDTLPLLKTVLRPHRVEMDLASSSRRVWAEPHLLQQVVFNLVNNACQAMKEAGVLGLETRVVGDRVELIVRDTGPGIPPEVQPRLFEPFFTTKKEGEGTGLGLSTVRAVVEGFGGEITFQTAVGEGTKFTASWPSREVTP